MIELDDRRRPKDAMGLLWGENGSSRCSYVTPIAEIVEDIRGLMGWDVELVPDPLEE